MKSPRLKPLSDRPIYLIADLHLEAGSPRTTRLFIDFLRGPVRRARALYILGDLFEVWIGDDDTSPPAAEVARALSSLSNEGVETYFLCGNRDFLLGDSYCRQAGMQRLTEPLILGDDPPVTALLHGDSLCTDDHDYQRFRAKVRDSAWQARALSRPLWWRRILARVARAISRQRNRAKSDQIMDVNPQAVIDEFRRLGVRRLIHGHTHRPAIHRLQIDDRSVERIVLGDWHDGRGSAVRLVGEELELLVIGHDPGGQLKVEIIDSGSNSASPCPR